jgi:hypothetical protein
MNHEGHEVSRRTSFVCYFDSGDFATLAPEIFKLRRSRIVCWFDLFRGRS